MTERPILMNAPMVRAVLDGSKTQTRRAAKRLMCLCGHPMTEHMEHQGWVTFGACGRFDIDRTATPCPYGWRGDRLWVREAWRAELTDDARSPRDLDRGSRVWFADGTAEDGGDVDIDAKPGKLRPSIHMPRWASRITLEVVGVRVERLQDVSDADAVAEGIEAWREGWNLPTAGEMFLRGTQARVATKDGSTAKRLFYLLWQSTGGDWAANPWVWVVEFRRAN